MQTLNEILAGRPRLQHALRPTPIHLLPSLSRQLGTSIYCKRDDLNGFGFSGNKIRKLEYLVHDALSQGCDTLVTCGSSQSNWCRMTAAAGAANGLDVHLVLGGEQPQRLTANLLLNQWLGARTHHISSTDDAVLESEAEKLVKELRATGRRPYYMVMGGSNGLGTFGYMAAMQEILQQEVQLGMRFDVLLHATASGGTQAGLIAGATLARWPGRIIGVNASRDADAQRAQIRRVLDRAAPLLGTSLPEAQIDVRDEYFGAGYRQNTAEAEAAIATFARLEGVFLDHVYTAKAAAGLIAMAQAHEFNGQRVLFIHTGGTPQLFE